MPTKKLIEVALPLDDINTASAREKSIRHGHPSTLHLWWARRPLAACRAVLFASLIDDPDQEGVPAELLREIDRLPPPELPDWQALPLGEQRRQRLFRFIKLLVQWESSNDERVLATAHKLIHAATGGNPPPVYDPFAGGGSIPLEAQRLGLEAHASDLNPVAVLINKALIEIPPKFAGMPPVNPVDRNQIGAEWKGAAGLAADVRYYGKWMRDEAERRIGHLYPKVQLPKEHGGGEATVIAWLWARTVTCPNPACQAKLPLVKSFLLAGKRGQSYWAEPIVDRTFQPHIVQFHVRGGELDDKERRRLSNGTAFTNAQGKKTKAAFGCVVCNASIVKGDYIDNEANEGRMGVIPLAIIAEGSHGRVYVDFNDPQIAAATSHLEYLHHQFEQKGLFPKEPARGTFASNAQGRMYGFQIFSDYFTKRQLVAIATFSQLVLEVYEKIKEHISTSKEPSEWTYYPDAIATYLAMCVSRFIDRNNTLCSWDSGPLETRSSTGGSSRTASVRGAFARQGLAMTWDFAESSPFSQSGGGFSSALEWIVPAIASLNGTRFGVAIQKDAAALGRDAVNLLISTDPPYYGNVGYADLSDFFYVWLRRTLGKIYNSLFGTLLVPKGEEITAIPWRFDGDRQRAKIFFEEALGKSFREVVEAEYPKVC